MHYMLEDENLQVELQLQNMRMGKPTNVSQTKEDILFSKKERKYGGIQQTSVS